MQQFAWLENESFGNRRAMNAGRCSGTQPPVCARSTLALDLPVVLRDAIEAPRQMAKRRRAPAGVTDAAGRAEPSDPHAANLAHAEGAPAITIDGRPASAVRGAAHHSFSRSIVLPGPVRHPPATLDRCRVCRATPRFAVSFAVERCSMNGERAVTGPTEPQVLRPARNGWMPNNSKLPVLLYRAAFASDAADLASVMETVFRRNGWPPQWRNGVYAFHHYHTKGHEVLGFASGQARLILGGPDGAEVRVQAGDVALLPAGTGHCRLEASSDFLVVGAYPPGQEGDICRRPPTDEEVALIASLSFPLSDPVAGPGGPLLRHWQEA